MTTASGVYFFSSKTAEFLVISMRGVCLDSASVDGSRGTAVWTSTPRTDSSMTLMTKLLLALGWAHVSTWNCIPPSLAKAEYRVLRLTRTSLEAVLKTIILHHLSLDLVDVGAVEVPASQATVKVTLATIVVRRSWRATSILRWGGQSEDALSCMTVPWGGRISVMTSSCLASVRRMSRRVRILFFTSLDAIFSPMPLVCVTRNRSSGQSLRSRVFLNTSASQRAVAIPFVASR